MAFYRKNIGTAQGIGRLALGILAATTSIQLLDTGLAIAGAALGVGFALTGIVGYCPMCAMAGIGKKRGG
ncbi:hypothetical protein BLJAPNOD_01442 [Ensifer sp. M14]|uniref:YgaP family membrane protein n=1 Tax=Ensifer sp. M14 TaxID=2203782 RepID=UPI000E1C935E|nr:DUF2892 domain-containing protein [Ensifer sp. M14]RDL50321.1 hypothetical protein BLJAPNOD_01442 [Ensifer sp. M14]